MPETVAKVSARQARAVMRETGNPIVWVSLAVPVAKTYHVRRDCYARLDTIRISTLLVWAIEAGIAPCRRCGQDFTITPEVADKVPVR